MTHSIESPNVPALMRRYGLRPDKRLGQNFLIDKKYLYKVVEASNLKGDETVLEIGAGLGSLTVLLSEFTHQVIAVEIDTRLIPALQFTIRHVENVQMVVGDILKLDIPDLMGRRPYSVIANIPYNITSLLIRHLMESRIPPEMIVLTLQKEVAQRIIATPGDLNLLALSVQVYGEPHIIGHIPAKAFFPKPKVDSSIIRITLHSSPIMPPDLVPRFFQLAKIGFNQKRKQIVNSLSAGLGLKKERVKKWLLDSDVDPRSRPQELELDIWVMLAETFSDLRVNSQQD
jgi:16S rRNA (adenine1518-N6/adenine1519-N6)-dimethyltransferase